ncbi:MAG: hypothetical protein E7527_05565 [Ruminococcaceae bacterium]|nr:hypothetical protein [Oscillospiraceae bacterium]
MKRTLSLLLSLCLLWGIGALPVAAEEPAVLTTDAFAPEVLHSVTDSNYTGWGLGFCFTLGARVTDSYEYKNAIIVAASSLTYGGETCPITRMGAIVTHLPGIGTDDSRMVRDTANARQVRDVKVSKAYEVGSDFCSFAVRVINIPYERENDLIYARPYVEIQYQGETVTLYGATDRACYADKMLEYSLDLPFYGTDIDPDKPGRLLVGETSVIDHILYLEVQDELDEWITMFNPEQPDVVYYACYDADGNELILPDEDYGYFFIRDMGPTKATETIAIPLPEGTAQVQIIGADIVYWTDWE